MSVNFRALLSHPFDETNILSAPDRLNSEILLETLQFQAFLKNHEYYSTANDNDTRWHWDRFFSGEDWQGTAQEVFFSSDPGTDTFLGGPGMFMIVFEKHMCTLDHVCRWRTFIEEPDIQAVFRRVAAAIVKAFNGNEAIYVPDSAYPASGAADCVHEGYTLEQTKQWCYEQFGPPVASLSDTEAMRPSGRIGGY